MDKIKENKEESPLLEMDSTRKIKNLNNALDISNMISVENMIALKEKSARIAKGLINDKSSADMPSIKEDKIHKIDVKTVDSKINVELTPTKGLTSTEELTPVKELTSTEEPVHVKELISVKGLTSTEEPVHVKELIPTKELTPAKGLTSAKELTSTEKVIINHTIDKTNTNKENITKVSNIVSKESLIEELETAQTDHLNYMKNIYVFLQLEGNVTNSQLTNPENYTMCTFGEWYYGKGQSFTEFDEFKQVESLHVVIHNYYLKIYKLYSITLKSSFFKTIAKLEKERLLKVEKLVVILESNSNQLIDLLDKIAIKIKSMNPKELESIMT